MSRFNNNNNNNNNRAYTKSSSKLKQNIQWQETDHPLVKCTKLPEFWRMKKSLGEKFCVRFDNNMVKDGTNVKITAGNYKNPWAELKNNEAIIKASVAEFSDLRFCSTSGRDTKFHVYIIVDTATPITITYINAIKVTVDGPRPKRIHNKPNMSKKPFEEDHNIDISMYNRKRKSKESTQKICELAKHHLQSSFNMTTGDRIIQNIDVNMSNSNDSSDEQQYEQCNSPVSENLNMLADVAVTTGSDSNSISSSPNDSDKSDYECTECQCSSSLGNTVGTSAAYCHSAFEQCTNDANNHHNHNHNSISNNNNNIMRCRSENELYQTNLIHNPTYPYNMYYHHPSPYMNTNYGALIMTNHHPIVIPIKTITSSNNNNNNNTNRNIYPIYPNVPYLHN